MSISGIGGRSRLLLYSDWLHISCWHGAVRNHLSLCENQRKLGFVTPGRVSVCICRPEEAHQVHAYRPKKMKEDC